jgi:hypothetical protein
MARDQRVPIVPLWVDAVEKGVIETRVVLAFSLVREELE